MELTILQKILRTVAAALQTPVMVVLILFLAFAAFCIGWLFVEALTERQHMNRCLPKLLDELHEQKSSLPECIDQSQLLRRQKKVLLELTRHPGFDRDALEALADNLYEAEQSHYDMILKLTGIVAKLAPMFGLLGTLIPLGPGIIALGRGDTYTLSSSMLTAFDTTIAGLVAAGVCLVVHTFRTHWYEKYMSDLEALIDCIVDLVMNNEQK